MAEGHARLRRYTTDTDSGISVSRSAVESHCSNHERRQRPKIPKRSLSVFDFHRGIQVDDVLWYCCFLMTILFFDLPTSLFTSWKVNWYYLRLSVLSLVALYAAAVYIRVISRCRREAATKQLPYLRILSVFLFVFSLYCFCISTWRLYQVWSLYIAFVSTMTLLSVISVL
jgi:hypothetical protein